MIKVVHGKNEVIVDDVSLLIEGLGVPAGQVQASFLRCPHDSGVMATLKRGPNGGCICPDESL